MRTHLLSSSFLPYSPAPVSFWPLYQTILLIGLIGLLTGSALAQNTSQATVAGHLRNPSGKPLEFATVVLLRADSSISKGAVTDTAGRYLFEHVMAGTYRVAATMVGYERALSTPVTIGPDKLTVTVPILTVREDSHTLGTVQVTAKKPFIEQLPDKTVLNVENSVIASGGTALDVLERAPGILVDSQNDRITLKGREGTLVMIDGKPTYLSAQEVVNLLRNTPSNSVETIELITNPSAKYDAAGNAGIINIRLKRGNRAGGTNGSANVGWGYGRFPKATVGLTVNHRSSGGLSLFGNYNYDNRESFGSVDALRQIGTSDSLLTIRNLGYRPNTARTHTVKAGADYAMGKRTTIGLLLNGLLSDNDAQIDNRNLVSNAKGELQQTTTMVNTSTRTMQRLSANANMKHSFDTVGRDLTVDLDLSRVTIQPQDNMQTRYFNPRNEEIQPALIQRNLPPSTVTIRAAKADYVHPFSKTTKLEAGSKLSYVTSDNDVRFETLTGTDYVPDPQRTNHFLYNETITAAYLNGSRDWGKWSVQGGIRAEHTRSLGKSITINKIVDRSYLNLFPTAFITYNASPEHQWRTSFSQRIDRPNYQDLNPFIYVMDPYTYREGNPFLRPQYTNAFQVGYSYKGETSVSLSYNHTTDAITGVNDQQQQVLRTTTVNLAILDNISLSVSLPIHPAKWWTIRTSADVFWNAYNAEYAGQRLDYRQLSANLTVNQSFVLPHGLTAELSGFYNSPQVYGQMQLKGQGQLSAGIQKTLWNKTAVLRLNISDMFHTMRGAGNVNFGTTHINFISRWESRVARLSFTYNFGNRNLKTGRQRGSGVDDEQSRIGGN